MNFIPCGFHLGEKFKIKKKEVREKWWKILRKITKSVNISGKVAQKQSAKSKIRERKAKSNKKVSAKCVVCCGKKLNRKKL